MPAKNSRKIYIKNGYYHLYNRGVEKRVIFVDAQDYSVFLGYLKDYLLPKNETELQSQISREDLTWHEKDKILKLLRLNNFSSKIDLLCHSLMPNHLHLLLKQSEESAIDSFFNSLMTRYVMYFNHKYKRVGPLFEGVYKAVVVESEGQLLHLNRYIHRNPLALLSNPLGHQSLYTSLPEYLGERKTEWVKPDEILNIFLSEKKGRRSYSNFVNQSEDLELIKSVVIEDLVPQGEALRKMVKGEALRKMVTSFLER